MKYCKEIMFQCLVLVTVFCLGFIAYDLSLPATVTAFGADGSPIVQPDENFNFYMNMLIPFILYMLSAGGLAYLILENIRMYKTTHTLRFLSKVIWVLWIVILVLSALLPVILGSSLVFGSIWYIFVALLIIISIIWMFRTTSRKSSK